MTARAAVLGLNRRNQLIKRENPRAAIRLVRDKLETKRVLQVHGVPVPPTLFHLDTSAAVALAAWSFLPDRWVMKPVHGSMGRGVLIARDRQVGGWTSARGDRLDESAIAAHAQSVLDGEHTDGRPDQVIVEPLLVSHPGVGHIAPVGLPDIRVIVHRQRPVMAMLRIPTQRSGGRGNLHQGGVGAAIDLATGTITSALHFGSRIEVHPESGVAIVGTALPFWPQVLDVASRCGPATGLGYLGADIVIDETYGVVVLEVNAHPGLEIQNVCAAGLRGAIRRSDASLPIV